MSVETHTVDGATGVRASLDEHSSVESIDETPVDRFVEFNDQHREYNITDVWGFNRLKRRMEAAETIEDWSKILKDHLQFGNKKLSDKIGIFNMNSATDCPNIGTDNCQVPKDQCYAFVTENTWDDSLPYRRRQEYLWDALDAETFAKAFMQVLDRKVKFGNAESVDQFMLRLSQSGDFRHDGDISKAERIAEILSEYGVEAYTYSASNYLDWDRAETLFVNASNDIEQYGDQRYVAVFDESQIGENDVHCPHDATGGEVSCGDCKLCITGAPEDVYIRPH